MVPDAAAPTVAANVDTTGERGGAAEAGGVAGATLDAAMTPVTANRASPASQPRGPPPVDSTVRGGPSSGPT